MAMNFNGEHPPKLWVDINPLHKCFPPHPQLRLPKLKGPEPAFSRVRKNLEGRLWEKTDIQFHRHSSGNGPNWDDRGFVGTQTLLL